MALANSLQIQGLVGNMPQVINEDCEQVDSAEVKEECHVNEGLVDIELFDNEKDPYVAELSKKVEKNYLSKYFVIESENTLAENYHPKEEIDLNEKEKSHEPAVDDPQIIWAEDEDAFLL